MWATEDGRALAKKTKKPSLLHQEERRSFKKATQIPILEPVLALALDLAQGQVLALEQGQAQVLVREQDLE